ncbi:MAG TPA: DUF892 family protein, partial [Verrucomicrobiae bacterium]|nr:DUF892 family protein [Verrucomicrobiae bacterium]
EHYEIASYGCLHEWAGLLGNKEAASLIEDILEEEKAANEKLMELARASCNNEALDESGDNGSEDEDVKNGTARRGVRPVSSDRKRAETLTK